MTPLAAVPIVVVIAIVGLVERVPVQVNVGVETVAVFASS